MLSVRDIFFIILLTIKLNWDKLLFCDHAHLYVLAVHHSLLQAYTHTLTGLFVKWAGRIYLLSTGFLIS